MSDRKLQSLSKKITRGVFFLALANVLFISIVLAAIRPTLITNLTQVYLSSLGNYVRQDVRYTLLVQDAVATREYADNIMQFPWIRGFSLQDAAGNALHLSGSHNWKPSMDDLVSTKGIHSRGRSSHLLEAINTTNKEGTLETIGYVHIEVDTSGLTSPVNKAFFAVMVAILGGTLVLWFTTSSVALRTAESISKMNEHLDKIVPDDPKLEYLALDTDTLEIVNVQRRINALVERVSSFKGTVEKEVSERTDELAVALRKNEEVEAVRRSLTMNLSHELKTPLTASIGYLNLAIELLEDDCQDLSRIQTLLYKSRHSSFVLSEEIHTLLQYSSSNDTDKTVESTDVNVEELVRNTIGYSSPLAETSGSVVTGTHRGREIFQTSNHLFGCILDNLLANAHKACKNGTISIDTDVSDNGWLTLIVHDTGIGIPDDEQEHIFDKYYRGTAPGHIGPRGMGIGLSMVRFWTDSLGGSINVNSRVGHFTRLTVRIPEVPRVDLPAVSRSIELSID